MNCCLEMNYRHTLASTQLDFHAHRRHHHVISLIRSPFLFSASPFLRWDVPLKVAMKGQQKEVFFVLPSPIFLSIHHFFLPLFLYCSVLLLSYIKLSFLSISLSSSLLPSFCFAHLLLFSLLYLSLRFLCHCQWADTSRPVDAD